MKDEFEYGVDIVDCEVVNEKLKKNIIKELRDKLLVYGAILSLEGGFMLALSTVIENTGETLKELELLVALVGGIASSLYGLWLMYRYIFFSANKVMIINHKCVLSVEHLGTKYTICRDENKVRALRNVKKQYLQGDKDSEQE